MKRFPRLLLLSLLPLAVAADYLDIPAVRAGKLIRDVAKESGDTGKPSSFTGKKLILEGIVDNDEDCERPDNALRTCTVFVAEKLERIHKDFVRVDVAPKQPYQGNLVCWNVLIEKAFSVKEGDQRVLHIETRYLGEATCY